MQLSSCCERSQWGVQQDVVDASYLKVQVHEAIGDVHFWLTKGNEVSILLPARLPVQAIRILVLQDPEFSGAHLIRASAARSTSAWQALDLRRHRIRAMDEAGAIRCSEDWRYPRGFLPPIVACA